MLKRFFIKLMNKTAMKGTKYKISRDGTIILKKYYGTKEATTYQIPDNVTHIDSEAFKDNKDLECIIASKELVSVGEFAFRDCTSLKKVIFFDNLKEINGCAFSGCKNLEEINLPNSLVYIGRSAFEECTSLKTINWPKKSKEIGTDTFRNCASLENISIPTSVKKIGCRAFENCLELKCIRVAEDCEVKDDAIDKECIQRQATRQKKVKTALKIPSKSVIINKLDMDKIKDLYLSSNIKYIRNNLFENAKDLVNVYYEGTIENWCNISFQEKYSNPMSVAQHLYFKKSNNEYEEIKDIIIPKSIKTLKNYQFLNISSLNSVAFEDAVTEIGVSCFENCINMQSIQLPEGLKKIYDSAFINCHKLDNIVLPNSINEIFSAAFQDCHELHSINLPSNIKDIPDSLFLNCTNLTTVEVKANFKAVSITSFKSKAVCINIGEKAFKNCTSLTNISDLYVNSIGQEAFKNCKSLRSISFDNQLKSLIGKEIFMNSGLTSLSFDNKVTSIPPRTFYKCKDLKEFNVTSGVITNIDSEAFSGTALEEIRVDDACFIKENALPPSCKVWRVFNEELEKEIKRRNYEKVKAKREAKASAERKISNAENERKSGSSSLDTYLRLAQQGDKHAAFMVGANYEVVGDYKEAIYWYNKSGSGQNRVKNLETRIRLRGDKPDKDYVSPNVAKGYETRASIKEKSLTASELYFEANDYLNGTNGHIKNQKKAIELYLRGAQQGSRYCQDKIAYFYETGQGVPQDLKKALMWYQRAANQGLYSAKDRVAELSKYVDAAVDAPNETFRGLKPSDNLNNDVSISTFTRLAQERLNSKPYPVPKCTISSCSVSNNTLVVNVTIGLSKNEITNLYGCENEIKKLDQEINEYNNKKYYEVDDIDKFSNKLIDHKIIQPLLDAKEDIYRKNRDILKDDVNRVIKAVFGFVNVVDKEYEINYATTESTAKRLTGVQVYVK